MGIAKRPKLVTKYSGPRAGERNTVSLDARCQIGEGTAEPVAVLDLDEGGCRVRGIAVAVTKNEPVMVWFGSVGPIAARLRWLKRGSAGLAFEAPLSEQALAEARRSAEPVAESRVIPLRRSRAAPED